MPYAVKCKIWNPSALLLLLIIIIISCLMRNLKSTRPFFNIPPYFFIASLQCCVCMHAICSKMPNLKRFGLIIFVFFLTSSKPDRSIAFRWGGGGGAPYTLPASLSGTFLQTLPDLVTPLKGHSLPSEQLSTDAVSALRNVWVLIWLWKQPSAQLPT